MNRIKKEYPESVFEQWISLSTKIAERPEEKVPISVSGYAADREYTSQIKAVSDEFYERITRPDSE